MNKYFTNLYNTDVKNETEILSDTQALIDDKEYSYDFKFINDNAIVLRINNKNYLMTLNANEEEEYIEVNLDSKVYNIFCKSELEIMIEKMSNGKVDKKTRKEIYSPMPGIITKLNVRDGQKVSKGEVLLVLEAMKMENEIKAAKDCVIKKINVEALKSVEKNELLIVLE